MQQPSLFDVTQLKSKVITRRGDFAALIDGFPIARAVTYVASSDVLLDIIEAQGFQTLELVLGDSLAAVDPESLRAAGTDLVERLAKLVEDGRLTIYVPRKTIHTKLCLLTRDRTTRVIMTSANSPGPLVRQRGRRTTHGTRTSPRATPGSSACGAITTRTSASARSSWRKPLASTELTKGRVQSASLHHTSFPLVFDDVNPSQRSSFEDVVKSHWESRWTPDGVSPQIVISSNRPNLQEWAKTRVKRIDFDVHFAPSEQNKSRLARFFDTPNPVFRWFSGLYLDNLQVLLEPRDDELHLGRDVMQRLYAHAGRMLPEFFPARPLEEIYDPGAARWRDLIHRKKQAILRRERDRLTIEITDDLQHHEVTPYLGLLPQTLKYERSGRKLIVENPAEFDRWVGDDRRSLLDRARGLFRR